MSDVRNNFLCRSKVTDYLAIRDRWTEEHLLIRSSVLNSAILLVFRKWKVFTPEFLGERWRGWNPLTLLTSWKCIFFHHTITHYGFCTQLIYTITAEQRFPPKSANYLGFGQSAFIHCQSLSSNSQFIVPQGAPLIFPSMVVTLLFCWIISFRILSDQ